MITKATPKKKALVQLTAGTGFRNENCIAARGLLDLLAGTNRLDADFGKIDCVQWRDVGWLADDLVIGCSASTGKRAAGISIKSDRQVTRAGFSPDFVATTWAQWFGKEEPLPRVRCPRVKLFPFQRNTRVHFWMLC
ncbi:hypothetical protein [Bradyrhizobium sp. USDA 3650]